MISRIIASVMALSLLVGCAGQASQDTLQELAYWKGKCQATGEEFDCTTASNWTWVAHGEAQVSTQTNMLLGTALIGGILGTAALGVAASNSGYHGGYHNSYWRGGYGGGGHGWRH
jgi:hypothetical protein